MIALALLAALLLAPSPAAAQPAPTRADFLAAVPPCAAEVTRCYPLHLHLAHDTQGQPVQTPAWLAEQVREANRLFEPLQIGFELGAVDDLPPAFTEVHTRDDRDRIGRPTWPVVRDKRRISLHLVAHLADVDLEGGVLRGVHWRDRKDRSRRWVILSAIAPALVLAHELGHYFGLPHSTYDVSIMNKTPRDQPPYAERGFHPDELKKMQRGLGRAR